MEWRIFADAWRVFGLGRLFHSRTRDGSCVLVYGLSTRHFRTTHIECLEAFVRRAGGAPAVERPQFFRAPEEHSAVQTVNMPKPEAVPGFWVVM